MNNKNEEGKVLIWIIVIIIISVIIYFLLPKEQPTEEIVDSRVQIFENLSIRLDNLSDVQPLSSGIIIIHNDETEFDFTGTLGPIELRPLAEIGEPEDLARFARAQAGVKHVITIDGIEPGQSDLRSLPRIVAAEGDIQLTIFTMAVKSNDGYIFFEDSIQTILGSGTPLFADNHDAGFEENTELASGFAGGQPDPERGEENIDNGERTTPQATVEEHTQLIEPLLRVQLVR